jgi:Txe/YoeB family toxin of toxin-antitoxin system
VRLLWSDEGWEDYLHWQQNDLKILGKINDLIKDVRRSPFKGLGKPEAFEGAVHRVVVAADHRRASANLSNDRETR